MKTEMLRPLIVIGWTVALVTGCSSIPSVGPDYEEPVLEAPACALPDAGMPTTNLTAGCEYRPAEGKDDVRVVVSTNVLAQWWKRFDDPVLVRLVEGGVSNNIEFLKAQKRLEQSQYELLGSYADYLPKFAVGADWTRNWQNRHAWSGNGQNGFNYNTQDVALDGNWEIDIFGGNRRAT